MPDLPIAAPGRKTGYRVQLPVFQGPLDLLLHLIEREELDITRVSLARVTGQYLEYLSALEELQVEDLSDFVVVAARLLLIKSEALLPRPATPRTPEDEDAGEQLLQQLRAYKQFKEAARQLEERQIQGRRSYVRLPSPLHIDTGIEHLEAVPIEALLAAALRVLEARPPALNEKGANGLVDPFPLSIDDQIGLITDTLETRTRVSFTDLLSATYSRYEVAVTLLAVLELIKQHKIQAGQERLFGTIVIEPVN